MRRLTAIRTKRKQETDMEKKLTLEEARACLLTAVHPVRTEYLARSQCVGRILTGGVSVGEYDLTPDAMQAAGTELLFRGVKLKPGMACAYGICRGKPVCALSGNPASAMANFYALTLPALRKLSGRANVLLETFPVKLMRDFPKASRAERLLRGRLVWNAGESWMDFAQEQENVVISSAIGCNMMAVIPAESGPACKGTVLQGFFL